ncbi:MAG: hypothetical protein QM736_20565 [Vicinamibacterales bacterium]
MTATGPQVVDRATKTASPITGADGDALGLVPTADQRNRTSSYARAKPILSAIGDSSATINTQSGLLAKMQGGASKVAAQANYNDDVAEDQRCSISGFTPLVARALGHNGVLTEQDVQSVRRLFPNPSDSQSLRNRRDRPHHVARLGDW